MEPERFHDIRDEFRSPLSLKRENGSWKLRHMKHMEMKLIFRVYVNTLFYAIAINVIINLSQMNCFYIYI